MAPTLALLPSPLLGPSVWEAVAEVLATQGWNIVTCAPPSHARTGQDVLNTFAAALPVDPDLVLVPHSNAGAYVPALAARRSVVGVVFVDAVLPSRLGQAPLAPPAFLDFLRQKTDPDGLLPVWTEWWPEGEMARLFPDRQTRARVRTGAAEASAVVLRGLRAGSGGLGRPSNGLPRLRRHLPRRT